MPRFRQHVCYSLTPSSSTVFAEGRRVQWNSSWNLFKILRSSCHNDRGMRSQTGAVFDSFPKLCERVWATLTLSERRLYTSSASLLFLGYLSGWATVGVGLCPVICEQLSFVLRWAHFVTPPRSVVGRVNPNLRATEEQSICTRSALRLRVRASCSRSAEAIS